MVNCCSLYHKDQNGLPQWFDLLLTVGDYEDIHFKMLEFKLAFQYPLGIVIVFLGSLLEHGVQHVRGNRGCIT